MTTGAVRAFRCSTASRTLGDPLEGTASTVTSFLLVESPGPWGVEALRDARLDGEVKARLRQLEATRGIRPLLVRRSVRPPASGAGDSVRIFAAHTGGHSPWVESTLLADVRELLDVDVAPLAQGRSVGLHPHPAQVFLVCTHGRHDACCAERGRPVAAAMASAAPDLVWEVSHIGGDRFAPNVLVLPLGLYYGGLDPADAVRFLETQLAGRLDLEHLRGRTAYAFPVQAAEIYLRRDLGLVDAAPLRLVGHAREGSRNRVELVAEGRHWRVDVETTVGEQRQLTCSATRAGRALRHRLLDIQSVGPT